MSRQSDLINEVKRIFENESNHETNDGDLNEMARKPFNNTLTEKGKEYFVKEVKDAIEEEKAGKAKHSDNFVFKTYAKLAKLKVGEAITTTELQQAAGVKHPQPMNAILSKLVAAGYITRATSHVEPEKGEPKPKGRPKGPEKEKVEKPKKLGADLPKKSKDAVSPSAIDKDNDGKSDDVVAENLDEVSIDEAELSEISLASLEKSLISKYGAKGDKLAEDESIEEVELGGAETNPTEDTRDNQSAIHPINESFALMQFRAGIITDTQYRKAIGLDKIK